ncbi:hypothetical protein BGZ73_005128 [Actinomortierella ambigua]|nr:hypothetical protein BGZ73_005128 [Actinomortierella ambigua]
MSFPSGPFQIKLRDQNLVLDVKQGVTVPEAEIILWRSRRDEDDSENQKWIYEHGEIRNIKSGLVLTTKDLRHGEECLQLPGIRAEGQLYDYYDYTISSKEDEDLVIGVSSKEEGANVKLVRRDNDDYKQMWEIIPL